ncbi:MAG: AsmA family protein [Spirochaetes bacterium]|nr:AsmA family protein [Spirochaetota bacterium]
MKKFFKITGIIFLIFIMLIAAAAAAVYLIVDKQFVEAQMEKALNRNVSIGNIDISVFSIVSGIEVNDVKISNYINPDKLKDIQDKPVEKNNIFVSLDSFKFKIQFLPLLKKQFVLKEITLYAPVINVVRSEKGYFNFGDLLVPKGKVPEEKKQKPVESKTSEPITADLIPLEISIGKIGIEKGKITYTDNKFKQVVEIYDLTFLVHSIELDAERLETKNSIKVRFATGIKTIGKMKSGSVQSFDLNINADADVKPFDVKTRILNPEISVTAGSNRGTVTGLQIFQAMKDIEQIEKYCGKLSFLKDSISWSDLKTSVWYKNGVVKTQDGSLKTDDYAAEFGGQSNINTKKIDYDVSLILADKYKETIEKNLVKNIEKGIKALKVSKYVKAETLKEAALKPMLNKDGKIYFVYKITGTFVKPDPELVEPKLPSITVLIKDALSNAGDAIKAEAEKRIKQEADAAKAKADAEAKKAADKAKKDVSGKIKNIIK